MGKQVVKILDSHRNGICGLGFHVAIVDWTENGETKEMLVVRFPKMADKETGSIVCAAFDLAQLDKREIRFFHNSYRGDHFHEAIDALTELPEGAPEHPKGFYQAESPGYARTFKPKVAP